MDRRFVSFLMLSIAIILSYQLIVTTVNPPPQDVVERGEQQDVPGNEDDVLAEDEGQNIPTPDAVEPDTPAKPTDEPKIDVGPSEQVERWFSVGSANPNSPYRLLVVFTNRGGAISRIELNSPKYRNQDDRSGYLGHLSLSDDPQRSGCRVNVVGDGTPAALAKEKDGQVSAGLQGPRYERDEDGQLQQRQLGDLIVAWDDKPVANVEEFEQRRAESRPGNEVQLTVERSVNGQTNKYIFTVQLSRAPIAVVSPGSADQGSMLLTLQQLDQKDAGFGQDEIPGLPSLRTGLWTSHRLANEGDLGPGIEFRRFLTDADLDGIGQSGTLEFVKRYRVKRVPESEVANDHFPAYHLDFEFEIVNHGDAAKQLEYQLDGMHGMTLEGWWYSYKTHPTSFRTSAGARDITWRDQSDDVHKLITCSQIVKEAEDEPKQPEQLLFESESARAVRYVGVDSQYFATALIPATGEQSEMNQVIVSKAVGRPVDDVDHDNPLDSLDTINPHKRADVSFRLNSDTKTIEPGSRIHQKFQIFAGPKQVDVLEQYGLEDFIIFGWFGVVSKPMLAILHFFHGIVGLFGLAIIMLTVLVKGLMFPLGRRMALNAQKMQELGPEMKKIAEKYKNDMEKRTKAQQELFRKHNCNPLSGCLPMFLQLPIFIGLYRGLSVDIELRQAPLIPGLSWCSNLAGPDKLWYWEWLSPEFLLGEGGMLGPYFNILPLVTVGLFMVHQKLFTPPPTDEQQQMQHQIMKVMMLVMGLFFFRVASGLCIYFIASSLWGLGERLLLPKPKPKSADEQPIAKAKPATSSSSSNGSTAKRRRKAKSKRR